MSAVGAPKRREARGNLLVKMASMHRGSSANLQQGSGSFIRNTSEARSTTPQLLASTQHIKSPTSSPRPTDDAEAAVEPLAAPRPTLPAVKKPFGSGKAGALISGSDIRFERSDLDSIPSFRIEPPVSCCTATCISIRPYFSINTIEPLSSIRLSVRLLRMFCG